MLRWDHYRASGIDALQGLVGLWDSRFSIEALFRRAKCKRACSGSGRLFGFRVQGFRRRTLLCLGLRLTALRRLIPMRSGVESLIDHV